MENKVETKHNKKKESSICWDCANAYAHKCSWFKDYTPVEGWTAEKRKYNSGNRTITSYCVEQCPNFISDKIEKVVVKLKKYQRKKKIKE